MSDVQVVAPQVSLIDPDAEKNEAEMLLDRNLASHQTVGKKYGIDWLKEIEVIKQEKKHLEEIAPEVQDQEQEENKGSDEKPEEGN